MATVVKMPKWGLMTEGTVGAWLQEEGAEVSEGDPLVTIETDKAVDDVPVPVDGILIRIVATTGEEVPVAGPVAIIAAPGETLSDEEIAALIAQSQPVSHARKAREAKAPRESRADIASEGGRVNASPAAKKLAAELDVDLAMVAGTGPGGRITTDDVEAASLDAAGIEPVEVFTGISGDRAINTLVAGPRSAQPIVFLHGLGGSYSSWQMVIANLLERYRLIAIDLPGHGSSDKSAPTLTDYSVSGLTAAVAETLDQAKVKDAVIAGHSLGGAIAIELALTRPDLVRGIVLVNSAGLGTEIADELLEVMAGEAGAATARAMLELFFEDQRFVLDRAVKDMADAQLAAGGWDAQQAVASAAFDRSGQKIASEERLASLQVPVLILWGERDRVIPLAHGLATVQVIPDATFSVINGAGHVPQVESAERTTLLIERFLKSLAP